MSQPASLPADAPAFARQHLNLADASLGAQALACSDDFFAPMARMLEPTEAVFIPGKYDPHGKWMDGWESRRRRDTGHDWCIIRLAKPGTLLGVDFDTSHFTGNYPPAAALEGCLLEQTDPDPQTVWQPLLPTVSLQANQHHYHPIRSLAEYSHLRIHLFPDGGLARLRVYGVPRYNPQSSRDDGLENLAACLQGARIVACNNQHFGPASRLLVPSQGQHMGDGWETRRRREPGEDWCIIALAQPGVIHEVDVDTAFFKGNYPDRCSLQGMFLADDSESALISQSMFWPVLLPPRPLAADCRQLFRDDVLAHTAVSHVRFNLHPDGGVSRLRLWGRPTP